MLTFSKLHIPRRISTDMQSVQMPVTSELHTTNFSAQLSNILLI